MSQNPRKNQILSPGSDLSSCQSSLSSILSRQYSRLQGSKNHPSYSFATEISYLYQSIVPRALERRRLDLGLSRCWLSCGAMNKKWTPWGKSVEIFEDTDTRQSTTYSLPGRVFALVAVEIPSIIIIASYEPSHLPQPAWTVQQPTINGNDTEVSVHTSIEPLRYIKRIQSWLHTFRAHLRRVIQNPPPTVLAGFCFPYVLAALALHYQQRHDKHQNSTIVFTVAELLAGLALLDRLDGQHV